MLGVSAKKLFGTLIGGLLSIGVFWVYLLFYPQGGHTVFLAVLLGAATVILAMGAGKLGAKSIDEALSK